MGQNLIEKRKCAGSEDAVQNRLRSISEQWEILTQKTSEKSMKLKEANRQRTFIAAVKDLDFWLGEVESLMNTDEVGKDLASVQNFMKKHQLVEADIIAHEDRIKDMNEQADSLIRSKQFDEDDIDGKRQSINERYKHVQDLAAHRQAMLNEANTLHQVNEKPPCFVIYTVLCSCSAFSSSVTSLTKSPGLRRRSFSSALMTMAAT